MELKEFTIREFADAIEKNGLIQARNSFFGGDNWKQNWVEFGRKVTSACAVGQASINLGVKPGNMYLKDGMYLNLTKVTWMNDTGSSFQEIADFVRKEWGDMLDAVMVSEVFDYTPFL